MGSDTRTSLASARRGWLNASERMTIAYRPLTTGDREFCIRVHHLSMRAYVEPLWGWDETKQDLLALESLEHQDAIHEIALLNERPIGYLSYQDGSEVFFIDQLYLHPNYQGKGHGSEIILRLIRLAHSRHKAVELSVLVTNARAHRFYERHGFFVVKASAERNRMRRSSGSSVST